MDYIRGQNTPHCFGEFDFGPVKLPGLSRNGPQVSVTITKVGSQYINSRARQPNLTSATCMHQWDSQIQDCSTQDGAVFYIAVNAIPLSHIQLFGQQLSHISVKANATMPIIIIGSDSWVFLD